jgi:transcriptional regulator with XRE-family HTH domain
MYEQGHREPSLDTIVLLAQEFEVTVDYLLTGRCICPQDIQRSSQVLHYLQKELQGSIHALLPDHMAQKEIAAVIAALLLDETAD